MRAAQRAKHSCPARVVAEDLERQVAGTPGHRAIRTHGCITEAVTRVRGGSPWPTDLLGDHVARRLRIGQGGPLRLGCAGRGGAYFRQRPRAAGRHLPLRAADVRGDGLLGNRAQSRRPAALDAGLRGDMAGGRQTRVLQDAGDSIRSRTRIERDFDPEAVRQMKATAGRDITVGGPDLAAQAIKAGLVDECHLFVAPIVVGGGKTVPSQQCPRGARAAGRTPFWQWRGSPPLPHQDVKRRRRCR